MRHEMQPGLILANGFRTLFAKWLPILIATVILTIPLFFTYLFEKAYQNTTAIILISIVSALVSLAYFITISYWSFEYFFKNKKISLGDAGSFLLSRFIPLFVTIILMTVGFVIATILALIPTGIVGLLFYGIYLLAPAGSVLGIVIGGLGGVIVTLMIVASLLIISSYITFTPFVVLFENISYFKAIRRSIQLVNNKFWSVLGNIIVLFFARIGIMIVIGLLLLPFIMAFGESLAITTIMTFAQQYFTVPIIIALVSLFFAITSKDSFQDSSKRNTKQKANNDATKKITKTKKQANNKRSVRKPTTRKTAKSNTSQKESRKKASFKKKKTTTKKPKRQKTTKTRSKKSSKKSLKKKN
ncbi:MAG: hypothetical protein ACQESC_02520 [Nanobdellota archaeon]